MYQKSVPSSHIFSRQDCPKATKLLWGYASGSLIELGPAFSWFRIDLEHWLFGGLINCYVNGFVLHKAIFTGRITLFPLFSNFCHKESGLYSLYCTVYSLDSILHTIYRFTSYDMDHIAWCTRKVRHCWWSHWEPALACMACYHQWHLIVNGVNVSPKVLN